MLEMPAPSVIPRATANDARLLFTLDDVVRGRETIVPPGRFFLIDRGIDELVPRRGQELTRRFVKLLHELNGQAVVDHDEFRRNKPYCRNIECHNDNKKIEIEFDLANYNKKNCEIFKQNYSEGAEENSYIICGFQILR